MTEDIREKLSLSRAGKSGSLAPWEREQIERDPVLREEVELNEVLERVNLETRTPPPPMTHMLQKARVDARQRAGRNSYFHRLVQYIEDRIHCSPQLLIQRAALLVAVLILWPLLLNGVGTMLKRPQATPAGSPSEIYTLTYAIQLPADSTPADPVPAVPETPGIPDVVRGAEHVCSEMMMRFSDWSEQYPELTKYTSYHSYINYEDLFREHYEGFGEIGVVRIDIKNEDGEVMPGHLRELAKLFEEVPGVGECVVVRVSSDGSTTTSDAPAAEK